MSVETAIDAVDLACAGVRLEPLAEAHRSGLREAAEDPDIWTHMPYEARGPAFDRWLDASVAASGAGREAVWAVMLDGAPVGSTRFLAIEPAHKRLEIGWTWYARQTWGTNVNSACKLMLLCYAFEELGLEKLVSTVFEGNPASRRALEKVGYQTVGIYRHHEFRHNRWWDVWIGELLREDWLARAEGRAGSGRSST